MSISAFGRFDGRSHMYFSLFSALFLQDDICYLLQTKFGARKCFHRCLSTVGVPSLGGWGGSSLAWGTVLSGGGCHHEQEVSSLAGVLSLAGGAVLSGDAIHSVRCHGGEGYCEGGP